MHAVPSASATPLSGRDLAMARGGLALSRGGPGGHWSCGLLHGAFSWLLARPCPLCRRLPPPGEKGCASTGLCGSCSADLALPEQALCGGAPLPWWCSASYRGAVRQALLRQKCGRPDAPLIRLLLQPLITALHEAELSRHSGAALLVPIPGWKRKANPLPGLIADQLARELGLRRCDLLERSHPVLGQHRLGGRLRQANQEGSFRLRSGRDSQPRRPVLLIDDILTTGATLRHAALCLQQAGWRVLGAACLARTPARGDWLRTP